MRPPPQLRAGNPHASGRLPIVVAGYKTFPIRVPTLGLGALGPYLSPCPPQEPLSDPDVESQDSLACQYSVRTRLTI